MGISRRAVLGGISHTAALAAIAVSMPAQLRAAQSAAAPAAPAAAAKASGNVCLAMIFPAAAGATFNGDMFRDTHLPLLKSTYGNSIERVELRLATPSAEGAPPAQIMAAVNIWIRDVAEFNKRASVSGKAVATDLANVTKAGAVVQFDEVMSTLGDDRLATPIDSLCLSTYFPASEGATMNAEYFARTFFPKMAETYGTAAIRRIEMTRGAVGQGAPKPVVLNSAHIYIRDELAYDEAVTKAGEGLFAEAQTHTNIAPIQSLTRVHAVG